MNVKKATVRMILFAMVCPVYISGASDGVCKMCPQNHYCTETTSTPCPTNSESPTGNTLLSNCRCKNGFSGPAGGECTAIYSRKRVTYFVTLAMTAAEFDTTKRNAYIAATARSFSLPVESVSIGTVTEIRGRRLLETSIEVETIIEVPWDVADQQAAADAIVLNATPENINAELSTYSIMATTMGEVAVTSTDVRAGCAAGTYGIDPGSGFVCAPCGVNQYSLAGAGECSNCPVDMISPTGSTWADCKCTDEFIMNHRTGVCDLPGVCVAGDGPEMLGGVIPDASVVLSDKAYSVVCHVDFPTQIKR